MSDREFTPEEQFEAAGQLAILVRMAQTIDVDVCRHMARESLRFDTVVSMTDPTRWIREHDQVEAASRVAEAFVEFRKVVDGATRR